MMPDADLRFFNGGRDEATAASTLQWIDPLLALCEPSVVFICLGLNDGHLRDPTINPRFALQEEPDRVGQADPKQRHRPASRHPRPTGDPSPVKRTTQPPPATTKPSKTSPIKPGKHATELGIGFIDLFEHTKAAYLSSNEVGGEPLTHNGKLPTESGHVIIASVVLRGIGVSSQQLEPLGWSPLRPIQMRRIRPSPSAAA